jgi:hypothetical protein
VAEYIEREAVMKHLRECEGTPPEIGYTYPIYKAIERFVKEVPAADVAPVVHGRWVKKQEKDTFAGYLTRFVCSECGRVEQAKEPHCHCGAKMEG